MADRYQEYGTDRQSSSRPGRVAYPGPRGKRSPMRTLAVWLAFWVVGMVVLCITSGVVIAIVYAAIDFHGS